MRGDGDDGARVEVDDGLEEGASGDTCRERGVQYCHNGIIPPLRTASHRSGQTFTQISPKPPEPRRPRVRNRPIVPESRANPSQKSRATTIEIR
ncbi:hypothetical protein GCM10022221_60110 [Actinocorallia aurea]